MARKFMLIKQPLRRILRGIRNAGGTPLIVGGSVRDALLAQETGASAPSKDIDVEVFGISRDDLKTVLSEFGHVDDVGESFAVIKLRASGEDFDFSLPRRDNKTGRGHGDFDVEVDHTMNPTEAARRRDFTINAVSFNPFTGEIIDPFGGVDDLRNRILRPTSEHFSEDPLRILRGFQFAARFNLSWVSELEVIGRQLRSEFATLAQERVREEWLKWAERGVVPSQGLKFLRAVGWLEFFPEVAALDGVPQDVIWHPEGTSLSFDCSGFANSTSSAKSVASNACLGKFFDTSVAFDAMSKSSRSTLSTHSIIRSRISQIARAFDTTDFDLAPSDNFSVTEFTSSESFMFSVGRPTLNASKVFRVMFKIPFDNVKSIMFSSSHKLEIFNSIIESVAVDVMNMLPSVEFSADDKLHNVAMNRDPVPFRSGFSHVFVPIFVVNSMPSAVDNDVIFAFDLCVADGDVSHNQTPEIVYSYITLHNFTTKSGDVFVHTCEVVDAMAWQCARDDISKDRRIRLMFAALCHDFGKSENTWLMPKAHDSMEYVAKHWRDIRDWTDAQLFSFQKDNWDAEWRWRSPAHDQAGAEPTRAFMDRLFRSVDQKRDADLTEQVVTLVVTHMRHIGLNATAKSVRRLARDVPLLDMQQVVDADTNGRPFNMQTWQANPSMLAIMAKADELAVRDEQPKPLLMGRHLIELGLKPSALFGQLIAESFEAQLDGAFDTVEGAKAWAEVRVQSGS